ncbi:hypothetical protein L6164_030809 [Bauhinia variegata]|uniref:Uncharacterized protein n=1 Tax=Bauhinia variegata TaxID=167791 RepID=A0ACB9LDT6_BAUVA|nr:hypothetical protein L6164_030809 [Bauhinia variegata]
MVKKSASVRIVPEKSKTKSNCDQKLRVKRFLITINILGSAGPMRFVVNEEDIVSGVIDTALKSYARVGRLPVLGSDARNFLLYCANGFEALNPLEAIGSCGARIFVLSKKQGYPPKKEGHPMMISQIQKRSVSWKAWLNKPFHFKYAFHSHRDIRRS